MRRRKLAYIEHSQCGALGKDTVVVSLRLARVIFKCDLFSLKDDISGIDPEGDFRMYKVRKEY